MVFRGWSYKKLFNNHEKVAKKRKELLRHYFWLRPLVNIFYNVLSRGYLEITLCWFDIRIALNKTRLSWIWPNLTPFDIYLLKVNNGNIRTMYETYSKLTISDVNNSKTMLINKFSNPVYEDLPLYFPFNGTEVLVSVTAYIFYVKSYYFINIH